MRGFDYRMLCSCCDEVGDCLLWRLGTNSSGHPYARIDGKAQGVRPYVMEFLMGKPRRPGLCIVPRCGNMLCLSPKCLVQRTRADLVRRSYRNGARGGPREYARKRDAAIAMGMAKLTQEIVDHIREHEMHLSGYELARKYGVSRHTMNDVKAGRTWRKASASPFAGLCGL